MRQNKHKQGELFAEEHPYEPIPEWKSLPHECEHPEYEQKLRENADARVNKEHHVMVAPVHFILWVNWGVEKHQEHRVRV